MLAVGIASMAAIAVPDAVEPAEGSAPLVARVAAAAPAPPVLIVSLTVPSPCPIGDSPSLDLLNVNVRVCVYVCRSVNLDRSGAPAPNIIAGVGPAARILNFYRCCRIGREQPKRHIGKRGGERTANKGAHRDHDSGGQQRDGDAPFHKQPRPYFLSQ